MMLKDMNEMFADDLRDPTYAAGYLNIALEEEGIEGFLYALQKVARAHGVSTVAAQSDIPRESLYRSLSERGNPGIKPLTRILEALGLRFTITASQTQSLNYQVSVESGEHTDRAPLMETEITTLRLRVEDEITALCRETRKEQEAVRRATQELQEESQRTLTQIQQLTTDMQEQIRQQVR